MRAAVFRPRGGREPSPDVTNHGGRLRRRGLVPGFRSSNSVYQNRRQQQRAKEDEGQSALEPHSLDRVAHCLWSFSRLHGSIRESRV